MKLCKLCTLALATATTAAIAPAALSAQLHDQAYYARHVDVAKARDIACNQTRFKGATLSAAELSDCTAARVTPHEAAFPEYVPGKGKAWSSAAGSN
jgi:hypothetical protein